MAAEAAAAPAPATAGNERRYVPVHALVKHFLKSICNTLVCICVLYCQYIF